MALAVIDPTQAGPACATADPGPGGAGGPVTARSGRRWESAAQVGNADPVELVAMAGQVMGLSPRAIEAQDAAEAEATVVACERVVAALQARQALAMDVLAGRVEEDLDRQRAERRNDPSLRHVDVHGLTASMLAPALHGATRTVHERIERSRWVAAALPTTFALLWDGQLDRSRADVVLEAAKTIDLDLWAEFEGRLFDSTVEETTGEVVLASAGVLGLSRAELARRARRTARTLDPEADRAALALARKARDLTIRPDRHLPGMARWRALIPTETSQRMSAAVEALAAQYARAHPGTPIGNHRADAMADLILGNATVTTTVELLVPIQPLADQAAAHTPDPWVSDPPATLEPATSTTAAEPPHPFVAADPAEQPAVPAWLVRPVEDPRHGCLAPEAIARLLAGPDILIRRARLDPEGSIAQDPTGDRPTAATRRRVRTRDGGCRFPGCRVPARQTDQDHVIPFPDGPTDYRNLISVCRTHHLFKHHGGWACVLHPDGTVLWTTTDGRTLTTHPHGADAARTLRDADTADSETTHHLQRGWIPGLPVGMTMNELAEAELAAPDDPPEPVRTPGEPPDWACLGEPTDLGPPGTLTPPATTPLERACAKLLALAA